MLNNSEIVMIGSVYRLITKIAIFKENVVLKDLLILQLQIN